MIQVKENRYNKDKVASFVKGSKDSKLKKHEEMKKHTHEIATEAAGFLDRRMRGVTLFIPKNIEIRNIMSNADRRERGFKQDRKLPDFIPDKEEN